MDAAISAGRPGLLHSVLFAVMRHIRTSPVRLMLNRAIFMLVSSSDREETSAPRAVFAALVFLSQYFPDSTSVIGEQVGSRNSAGRAAASMNRRFMARICDPVPACQNPEHLEERHLPGAGIGTLAYAFDGAEGLCLAASACRHGGFSLAFRHG